MIKELYSMSTERLTCIYKAMYSRDMWSHQEKHVMGIIEDIVTARTGTDPLSWNGTEEERRQPWHRH